MSKKSNQHKVPHGFLARTVYHNTLPDIPFEPKYLEYQFDSQRFTEYKSNSLENQHKIAFHVPRNLGIPIDLISPKAYQPTSSDPAFRLHPDDEALCEDEKSDKDLKRSEIHNKATNIFRRSVIISAKNKHYGKLGDTIKEREMGVGHKLREKLNNRNQNSAAAGMDPTQQGENAGAESDPNSISNSNEKPSNSSRSIAQRKQNEEDKGKLLQNLSREQQIEAIERGFEAVKDTQKYQNHHSKKDVHAVEYLPIFPDFECWQHPCCQVVFQNDPSVAVQSSKDGTAGPITNYSEEELSQAMIRGMVDADGDQFVAYFMPTQETLEKRNVDVQACVAYDENEIYDYKLAKEFNWIVKNFKNSKSERYYFFCWRNNQVFYNELDTKVRLTKRKQKEGKNRAANRHHQTTKATLKVKHRNLNNEEQVQQQERFQSLTNEDEDSDDSSSEESNSENDDENQSVRNSTAAESTVISTRNQTSTKVASTKTGSNKSKENSDASSDSEDPFGGSSDEENLKIKKEDDNMSLITTTTRAGGNKDMSDTDSSEEDSD